MAGKDITELIFQISQRGTAQAIKEMDRLEGQVEAAAKQYLELQKNAEGSGEGAAKSAQGLVTLLRDVERQAANASKNSMDIFGAKQLRKHEDSVRKLQVRYSDLLKDLTKATASGDKTLEASVRGRMRSIEKVASSEVAAFNRVYQEQKGKIDDLVSTEKQSLASLTKNALAGGGSAIQELHQSGNVGGVLQMGASGIRGLGRQAGARSVAMGGAAAGGAAAGLAAFAKVAAPLAIVVGTLGMVVKLFFDLDEGIKDVNRSILKNTSLTQLASSNYGDMHDRIADAKLALKEFHQATRNADLRNLGLSPEDMAAVNASLSDAGLHMGQLRDQGVEWEVILERVQNAALLLGVEATDTTDLIGTLVKTSALSFDQASEALVHIVNGASEAGISSKKFFGVIQNLVGQMGLYNYKVSDSVRLFTDLNKVMDEQSASTYLEATENRYKNMSAASRMTSLAIIAQGEGGIEFLTKAIERAMKHIVDTLDPDKLRRAFEEIGKADLLNERGFEGAVRRLSETDRDRLFGAMDKESKELFSRYIEIMRAQNANPNTPEGMMLLQQTMGDWLTDDKDSGRIRELETATGIPLDRLTSALTENLDVASATEDELRALRRIQRQRRSDVANLRGRAGSAGFAEFAKGLGYDITDAQARGVTTETLHQFRTPVDMEKVQEEQVNYAKDTADLQRTLTDTVKNEVVGKLSGIMDVLHDIHDGVLNIANLNPKNFFGFGGTGHQVSQDVLQSKSQIRKDVRAASSMTGAEKEEALQKIANEKARVASLEQAAQWAEDLNLDEISNPSGNFMASIEGRDNIVRAISALKIQRPEDVVGELEKFSEEVARTVPNISDISVSPFGIMGMPGKIRQAQFDTAISNLEASNITAPVKATTAYDARILKRGIPLLDFQAGDIVVDRESLADAVVGGRGAFVPTLMDQAGAGRGAGGGGQKTMNANFYIYGGDAREVRTTVLRVIEEWERRRSVS